MSGSKPILFKRLKFSISLMENNDGGGKVFIMKRYGGHCNCPILREGGVLKWELRLASMLLFDMHLLLYRPAKCPGDSCGTRSP